MAKPALVDVEEVGSYRRPFVDEHDAVEHDFDAIHCIFRIRKAVS
jgi:hypothetical protein